MTRESHGTGKERNTLHAATRSGRYVWACSVCFDPNYTREGQATYYLDERWCPTCQQRQPIISFHAEDVPNAV